MATNTHTTATVKLSLDLGELITQLRTLADTLEATQRPRLTVKAEDAECKHEAWDVHPNGITRRCSDCRAPLPDLEPGTCHCGAKPNEVHNPLFAHPERVTVSEVYINPNPNGFTPEAVEALVDAEMRRARHRLPDGDFPCCAPEPANYTDGTQPYRNPHTLDLPEGIDPAEAQHMLEVIADAQAGRTMPTVFGPRPHARPLFVLPTQHGQLAVDLANENTTAAALRCPRCDDPWPPRETCPACGCDNYRKNNPK